MRRQDSLVGSNPYMPIGRQSMVHIEPIEPLIHDSRPWVFLSRAHHHCAQGHPYRNLALSSCIERNCGRCFNHGSKNRYRFLLDLTHPSFVASLAHSTNSKIQGVAGCPSGNGLSIGVPDVAYRVSRKAPWFIDQKLGSPLREDMLMAEWSSSTKHTPTSRFGSRHQVGNHIFNV